MFKEKEVGNMKYFISYIWWHKHRSEEKNYENTTTDKHPIKWLLDIRKYHKVHAEKEWKEHQRQDYYEFYILFYAEISEENYKTAKNAELGE
jgi:hypothetical protein